MALPASYHPSELIYAESLDRVLRSPFLQPAQSRVEFCHPSFAGRASFVVVTVNASTTKSNSDCRDRRVHQGGNGCVQPWQSACSFSLRRDGLFFLNASARTSSSSRICSISSL